MSIGIGLDPCIAFDMPRKILNETKDFPFHITNRSNNRDYFYIPLDCLWQIMLAQIKNLTIEYNIRTHAFILMSNHYHWVLSTPNLNLSNGMTHFHREVARKSNKHCGRINHFFGGRYKWCLIGEEDYYRNCLKYVYRNPVKAGICQTVQDYPYSSLNQKPDQKLWQHIDFFNPTENETVLDINWLNEAFSSEQDLAIQKGLRRRSFALPKDKCRKKIELDTAQYKKGLGT